MNFSEKYSQEEWKAIASTPQSIGAIMASASFSGLVGSGKEMFESVQSIMTAKKEYPNNPLIQEIVPDASNRSEALSKAKEQREFLMDKIKANNIKSSEELRALILADCNKTISLLSEKEVPEVVSEYKKWVLDIADNVAHAAKEGDFLGFGGERFSEKEQHLFNELKTIFN